MASDEKRSAIESVLANLESMDGPGKDIEAAREELRALRAENAAMREALEKIADAGYPWVTTIARTALGGSHG